MNLVNELREAEEATDLELFRADLLEAVHVRASESAGTEELDFAFVCEVGERLASAEEFVDFIPCHGKSVGYRSRNLRVDGYELDETDDSIRLLIADFRGGDDIETITRTRADAVFAQLKAFVEESASGRVWSSAQGESVQTKELAGTLEQHHRKKDDGSRLVSRYRFYLITDAVLSDRVKDLPIDDLDGVPIERHIWDVSRLKSASTSILGTEELEIDFTEFAEGGLPCLRASQTADYDGYLCVIPGEVLAELYDRFGSRLLEGNVRSFLSTTVKINKGIQATIRAEADKFFVFNNGISATATSAVVEETDEGPRLISVRYLQIVNGGQTTASLHIAKRKDHADLRSIYVPMKLSVVRATDTEILDEMIQKIARYSNSQNKVSDADFFSNHPFHRAIERRSRSLPAPMAPGATFNTFWFYERARGQYVNAQAKMTLKQKKEFARVNPRAQLLSKTDLAKVENSWRMLPHIVSRGAQKNFINFAEFVGKNYGTDGPKFDNDVYFKEVIAKAILFRFAERMVSEAKKTWYAGDYRAQIVTYTIAKLASVINEHAIGFALNLNGIWLKQGVSVALSHQLEEIAKVVAATITAPPVPSMNVSEWCKKEDCWKQVTEARIPILPSLQVDLVSTREICQIHEAATVQAVEDLVINAIVDVVKLRESGCWNRLSDWTRRHHPLVGKDADLLRLASQTKWIPSDKQAKALMNLLRKLEQDGFKRS